MGNSYTEHSRKLRAKTATESTKRLIAAGVIRKFALRLKTELANEFDAIAEERALSRPETLKLLVEFYRSHHPK